MRMIDSPTAKPPADSRAPGPRLPPHDVLAGFYGEADARAGFVNRLFDHTAVHYNWISSVLSFGTDRQYRKSALRRAGLRPGMKLLDVASGTGLVARAALGLGLPPRDIIGLDPSRGMLAENRKRHGISLIQGIGERLPFPGASFDFVTMGYALRHVEDLGVLCREFYRVLRPEGRLLVLEISRPSSRLGFRIMQFYMRTLLPRVMRLCTRDREAATLIEYYWATIAECVAPPVILQALKGAGFPDVQRKKCGSLLSDYVAAKSL